MATVSHFIPSSKTSLICCKGNQHEEQPLNLVCLDPLCRNNPLACSVCFVETHKYHKVVGLSNFINDYSKNTRNSNTAMLQNKISIHYQELKIKISDMKYNLERRIEDFEKAVSKYIQYLSGQSLIRNCVGSQLNIELEPARISQIKSQAQLENSLRFILNNCLYDQNLSMLNISQILKQNEQRVCALLDKVVYMTDFCEKSLSQSISLLGFANQTLKEEKQALNKKIKQLMNRSSKTTSVRQFQEQNNKLKKLIQQTSCLVLEQSQRAEQLLIDDGLSKVEIDFNFGQYRSENIQILNNGKTIKSALHGQKPQFALATPFINSEPKQIKQWALQIKKCRNFASENTISVGICKLSDMLLAKFKGNPTNCLMVSSQGYASLNRKTQKTNFIYQEGDVLHLKYDPFYRTLEITKQNGRKIILKTFQCDEPVYACVRLTYAPDEITII